MANRIVRGFLSVLGGKSASLLISFIITPVIVQTLGSSRYGTYATIVSVSSIVMIFVSPGISGGVRKYLPENRDVKNWNEKVVSLYFWVAFLLVAVIAGILVLLSSNTEIPYLDLGRRWKDYLLLLAIWIVGQQLFSVSRSILMALSLEHYSEPIVVFEKMVFASVSVTLLLYGGGIFGVLVGHIIGVFAAGVIGFYLCRTLIDFSEVFIPSFQGISKRELLSFNMYSILLLFLVRSLYHVDILMLSQMVGSQHTGFYKAALVIAEFLWFAPMALQIVFLQSSARLWAEENLESINELASNATRYTLLSTLLFAIGLALLADEFITIYYSEAFLPSTTPLLLLIPGAVGFAVARPILAITQAKGDMLLLVLATSFAAGINFLLNILFIPRYGMIGAAIATSIGYGSMLVFHLWTARTIGLRPFRGTRLAQIMVTAIVSVPPIFFGQAIIDNNILALLVVPVLGLFTYMSMAILTEAITRDEIVLTYEWIKTIN